ncbi:MAG: polysaccharide pyruvyl transferase family protein [Moritella sp.]|uniref:polysaccharide pyruvyl transferase family protein n=1 Tax=Moritella sp. TaxID=78556 RepID=UPI001D3DD4F1|nr:polysaccharide pyruvyl transferase family protein [Moritella sp.]NQZ48914.1 polysaccharide pyruvyl transferase family protein [Moritella sp.]
MKKIVLIHCYSDQNRGDAGIIESTIDLIRDIHADSKVDAISVFHEHDERFKNDHYFTSKIVTNIHPALFFEPSIQKNGRGYSVLKKVCMFFKLLLVNALLLLFPNEGFAKFILSSEQFKTFKCIKEADVVISKGGSFLYSLKGVNGDFFLFRMLFSFLLPLRMNKKVGIFSQSVGPFENSFSKHALFFVLKRLDHIYLREEKCLKFLPQDISLKVDIIPDSAFYLKSNKQIEFNLSGSKKVAITARPHKFSNDNNIQTEMFEKYLNSLAKMAIYLISIGYEIHLIGQVTGPSRQEDDRVALAKLNEILLPHKNNVVFWDEEKQLMSPKELQSLYSKMNMVIGTRLHSSIFSMAAGVPTINISYHGTKSQGIMKSVGLEDFVMDITKMDSKNGIKLIDTILEHNEFKLILDESVKIHRKSLYTAMNQLVN